MEEGVTTSLIRMLGRRCFANATRQKDFRDSSRTNRFAANVDLAMA